MSLDRDAVSHIARLARINVADGELDNLAGELSQILSFVEQLNSVDTTGVEPMVGVGSVMAPLRDDVVTDGAQAEAVVSNAPDPVGPYFGVPKVIE
jgi:aspartyl-tRNA(Asn)/glutamyl-tRNA(Gln) amidotransferase subunit C